jgi:hypothetical protein
MSQPLVGVCAQAMVNMQRHDTQPKTISHRQSGVQQGRGITPAAVRNGKSETRSRARFDPGFRGAGAHFIRRSYA